MRAGRFIAAVALGLLAAGAGCARRDAAVAGVQEAVPIHEAAAIEARGFAASNVGYVLRDLDSGRTLAAHNSNAPFIPASVAKVPTAVAALEVLGGAHRFRTSVRAKGEIEAGVLQGDLVLVGGGDPLLGPDGLLALCRALHRNGLRRVDGRFLHDESLYATRTAIRAAQPQDAQYNPGVSALSLDFNRLRVAWQGGGRNGAVTGYTVPPLQGIGLEPSAVPDTAHRWKAEIGADGTNWRLHVNAAESGETWLPVKRPGRVTAQVFRRLCGRVGVALPAPEPGTAPPDAPVLAAHRSQPLAAVMQGMLRYSNNLVAELVGLATGWRLTGEAVTLARSARAMRRWWGDRLPEVDWSGYVQHNHSGLDASGRATPAQIAAILDFAEGRGYADGQGNTRGLPDLLPAAGWEHGLGGRLQQPATALAVWAKTGTMHYASALAGYLYPGNGRRLAFAIFVGDLAQRRAYDAAADRDGKAWRARVTAWRRRAKALEADLIAYWATTFSG
ncbi:D-alanyl-D-alanine carboxypeptidase/D-alanyl-D-alanine endopeptidase [Ferruginivarius sediminum]|uniref:D-alanyl-D-alanine carboxypeptidase/D-alanyl-D-alanine-endopeptidase n=1 Tax=Ferruginivarius sediminum TaxID=2661937 RepID=A0A369T6B5_9PROT|nr:D-alanyl-D-alanine carboxypeptidase/D-alanyl-D-alanine-endopeptidase [Ferruginivarius sediminum]RDD60860.1 D-alanyl-D-alanine carboxypeptidase/D-alanyl-D-alanine-endopeptidase [Ferruginivarius sediminum]